MLIKKIIQKFIFIFSILYAINVYSNDQSKIISVEEGINRTSDEIGEYDLSESVKKLNDSDFTKIWINIKSGSYDEAKQYLDEKVKLFPDNYLFWYMRAYVNFLLGKIDDDVLNDLNKVINLNPKYAYAYNMIGVIKQESKQYEEAIKYFDKAIKLKPDYSEAYSNRGVVKSKLSKYDEALKDCEKAVEVGPNVAWAYYNRGGAKLHFKKAVDILNDMEKAIKLNPNLSEAYIFRIACKVAADLNFEAIEDLDKLLKLNPKYWRGYLKRAFLNGKLSNFEDEIRDCGKVIELKPDVALAYKIRGRAKASLFRYEEGISDISKAIDMDHDASEYAFRGILYSRLNKKDEALKDLNEALSIAEAKLKPGDPLIDQIKKDIQNINKKER